MCVSRSSNRAVNLFKCSQDNNRLSGPPLVCFRYRGREVAIKTVNLNGHDIQECQEKQKPVSAAASLPVCYRRAAAKILKELILLTELAHSNFVEVGFLLTWLCSYLSYITFLTYGTHPNFPVEGGGWGGRRKSLQYTIKFCHIFLRKAPPKTTLHLNSG